MQLWDSCFSQEYDVKSSIKEISGDDMIKLITIEAIVTDGSYWESLKDNVKPEDCHIQTVNSCWFIQEEAALLKNFRGFTTRVYIKLIILSAHKGGRRMKRRDVRMDTLLSWTVFLELFAEQDL